MAGEEGRGGEVVASGFLPAQYPSFSILKLYRDGFQTGSVLYLSIRLLIYLFIYSVGRLFITFNCNTFPRKKVSVGGPFVETPNLNL